MRYSYVAAPLALAAGVSAHPAANGTIAYTTEVVTAFTTFCPSATELVHGGSTYTVTEATTLTISDCPCTLTKPVSSATPSAVPIASSPAGAPVVASSAAVVSSPAVVPTSATPVDSVTEVPSAAPVTSAPIVPVAGVPSGAPVPSSVGTIAPPTFVNSTVPSAPVGTAAPTGSAAPTTSGLPFTGAANKMAASGISMVALLGLAAYLL